MWGFFYIWCYKGVKINIEHSCFSFFDIKKKLWKHGVSVWGGMITYSKVCKKEVVFSFPMALFYLVFYLTLTVLIVITTFPDLCLVCYFPLTFSILVISRFPKLQYIPELILNSLNVSSCSKIQQKK